jgi:hypothetical protein
VSGNRLAGFRLLRAGARLGERLLAHDPVLPAIERRLRARGQAGPARALFILGPPRSGTTLLLDLATSTWRTSYPTNLCALLYRSPLLAWKTSRPRQRRFTGQSRYGFMGGLGAPSEARPLFEAWFGPLADPTITAPVPATTVRETLRALEAAGGPFVAKNLGLGLRLERVHAVLPQALYLRMRRDRLATAASLLRARRALHGGERIWFGIRPPGCAWLDELDPAEQIAWQIRLIETAIERAAAVVGPDRLMTVSLEGLREAPATTLRAIETFCAGHGLVLEATAQAALRPHGGAAAQAGLDAAAIERIEQALERVAGAPVPGG